MTTGTALRQPRPDPLDCGQGCYPPHRPFPLTDHDGSTVYERANQTWDYLAGDRWVCLHGAAYEAYDPSNSYWATTYRMWRRIHGFAARRARRDAARAQKTSS